MPPTNDAERVGLLLRVSSEEQRDRETIEIQRDFLTEYCRLYGLDVAGVYADDGVSGTIPLHERPEGGRLLEEAKAGAFGTLLVYRLDRLGRSLLVIVDAHDRLQAAGVALRSATEPIDTSSPSGRLIFQMLASFAEYERETIRERTRAGLHRAYRGGKHYGVAPYGYQTDDGGRLQIVPEEAEIVRGIIGRVAEGSSLYAEAKRLNDLGIPTPGWRYGNGKKRPGAALWSVTTVSNIVHQSAYSGVHKVKTNGGKDVIEQAVPPVLADRGLQDRAAAALTENRRYPDRKKDRRYLLRGLVKCAACGAACTGHPAGKNGKTYHYYTCRAGRTNNFGMGRPHKPPCLNAGWLEDLVWADVRRFLENPGEVLERVREQIGGQDDGGELEARHKDLAGRLASRQPEKDRYVRTYAQGHISEEELEVYLADLKNQTENLRLLLASVEADLSQRREQARLADTTEAWLRALRERVEEVEGDTPEAFRARRRPVKLLVQSISAGKRPDDGRTEIQVTYRFGPPTSEVGPDQSSVAHCKNGSRS
ncbi:MAG TPA: recombinase family protein [Rubrobacter sp.]|nr:recombinase family protein [Rubrobacter sp.]